MRETRWTQKVHGSGRGTRTRDPERGRRKERDGMRASAASQGNLWPHRVKSKLPRLQGFSFVGSVAGSTGGVLRERKNRRVEERTSRKSDP